MYLPVLHKLREELGLLHGAQLVVDCEGFRPTVRFVRVFGLGLQPTKHLADLSLAVEQQEQW